MERDYTPIPNEWGEEMEELSDEEFGRLVRACMRYCESGEESAPVGNERFYLRRAMNTMRRFNEGWEAASEKRKAAGAKGASVRWQREPDGTIIMEDSNAISDDSKNSNAINAIAEDSNAILPYSKNSNQNQNQSQSQNQKDISSVCLSTRARAKERKKQVEPEPETPPPEYTGPYYALLTLPKWVTVDDDIKDEVTQIAKDIYTAYVPGKQVSPGVCISLYNQICEVESSGKVYVSNERVNILKGAYQRAKQMGKPGNWNVIKFILEKAGEGEAV